MTALVWGAPGDKTYETGLDRGVLYARNEDPEAWNGLVSLTENVAGGEVESFYYDGVKYLDIILYEDYQATLEAFSFPLTWNECDGARQIALGLFATQQPRKPFDLSWRTKVGNDLTEEAGYKLHLLYNCMATPTERVSTTISADVSLPTRSWTIYTAPPEPSDYGGESYKPTAHLVIDSRFANPTRLELIEQEIYGNVTDDPRMPTQDELVTFINTGFWS
jgi:hypothetical protein